jgi:hypothetical protein
MRLAPVLLALWAASAAPAFAACGDDPGDAAAVADARADVAGTCDCAGASGHGRYVRCAVGVARGRVGDGRLRAACRRAVFQCAARSTCGRPGAVACCLTRSSGDTQCRIVPGPSRCIAPAGGSECVSRQTSCCDACGPTGCATTTTTTIPPCGGGPFMCSGACPSGLTCEPVSDFEPYCGCVPDGSQACGDAFYPYCNGTCPSGETCGTTSRFPQSFCFCHPSETASCGEAAFPGCGGACPAGQACFPLRYSTFFDTCGCTAPGPCGGTCGDGGACPTGQVCQTSGGPCSCVDR